MKHQMAMLGLLLTALSGSAQVTVDELNGSTLGIATGISYTTTPNGEGAVFLRASESRIEYPFSMGLPHEGTIEMTIKVTKGYSYNNYVLNDNQMSACIFNTGSLDVWYRGAMWVNVDHVGSVSLTTALTPSPTWHTLSATNTTFRFNEWHVVSFSYGSQGQYLKVDGVLVASNATYTEALQTCGDWGSKRDQPTVGEIKSVFWANNRYDNGFEGVLDRFRFSNTQEDWSLVPPRVLTQPTSQTVAAGLSVTLSVTASGSTPLSYQWGFNGQNIAGETNATLTVTNTRASDSGGYSVRVANAAGSVVSATAHLAVLADGANDTPPEQVTTRPVPPREPSHNNLVVITHGWQVLGQHAAWVDEMANGIQARLTSEGKSDWQVVPIHWSEWAAGTPAMALIGGRIWGALYGAEFSQTQWNHIHLIAHSAGSAFIEAFAKEIKTIWPTTDVHCTFLDPYLSVIWGVGIDIYGQNADWSDCYYAAEETGVLTKGTLINAHNVEVTGLDPDARYMPLGGSLSSHGWPYRFYAQTVSGAFPGAGQYGFSRSKEVEGWGQRGDYPMNNSPVILPTSASPSPFQGEMPFIGGAVLALDGIPLNTSGDGVSLIGSFAFSMSTPPVLPMSGATRGLSPSAPHPFVTTDSAQPAWLAVGATVTSEVNFVQFDAGFTSPSAAEGLLTVFWNTNQIGVIDERTATPAFQTYRFELPSIMAAGVYTLSFRLDSFGSTESSVVITNVATGISGIVDPIVLGWASSASNVWPTLEVTAPTGFTYLVQTSTNLIEWVPQGFHLHTNAVMQFADPDSTNSRQRFYKAVLP